MNTIFELIFSRILTRLQDISIANGYRTDAGANVFGGRTIPSDRLPGISLFVENWAGEPVEDIPDTDVSWPIRLEGATQADIKNPYSGLFALHHDLIKALERPDDTHLHDDSTGRHLLSQQLRLVGATPNEREDGSKIETLALDIVCEFPLTYGDPTDVPP